MSEPDQATAALTERAKQFKEATDKVRERSDAAAKALAALGTTGLTAVGISKFADVFPTPDGEALSIVLVIGGFVLMAIVTVAFTLRLVKANRPLVTSSDAGSMDVDPAEQAEVEKLYDTLAKRNRVASLRSYEARGARLQRIADRMADRTAATAVEAKAARVRAESDAVQARAALVVSRLRMNKALRGGASLFLAILFLVGLLAFGLAADHLESKRTSELAAYKACAEAATAGVMKLPSICKGVTAKKTDPAPEEKRRDALLTAYTSCLDAAVKQSSPIAACDGLRTELEAAAKKVP